MNRNTLIRAAVCLATGAVLLVVCAVIDERDSSGPLRNGFAYAGPVPDWPGVTPFVAVEVDRTSRSRLAAKYRAILVEFKAAEWDALLADGRVPRVGEREALAGALCTPETFSIAGEMYTVTGRIRREVPSLSAVYAVPYTESEAEAAGVNGVRGFYDWDARKRVADEEFEPPEGLRRLSIHETVPMLPGLPLLILAGLTLTLYGSAVLQWALVLRLNRWIGAFGGLVRAQQQYPRTFRFVFLVNYGTFLMVMLFGVLAPHANLAATSWIYEVFEKGDLRELGAAYMAGNIPLAAWETFRNNFIVQTFLFSSLPSIFIPYLGVLKTLLSLLVVGFAMAPLWSGSAAPMTYHWITIAVELQAYIAVSFGICAYTADTAHVLRRAWRESYEWDTEDWTTCWYEYRAAFEQLVSATMYACVALAVAAAFEAVTLISLGTSIVS